MDSGYYAAMAGLVARTQALDTAAANLANAQTPGYRAEREYFRSVLLGPDALDSQLGRTVNNFGLLGGDRLELDQGALTADRQSARPGHRGRGLLPGPDRQRPALHPRWRLPPLAAAGQLVTAAGEPVLSDAGQPIAVPPGEVTVGADGVLSVAGGVVATVGVFTLSAGTQLTPEGANRYVAPQGVKAVLSKKGRDPSGRHRGRQ